MYDLRQIPIVKSPDSHPAEGDEKFQERKSDETVRKAKDIGKESGENRTYGHAQSVLHEGQHAHSGTAVMGRIQIHSHCVPDGQNAARAAHTRGKKSGLQS